MKEHKTFKPFDKVLVQNMQGVWMIDFYSNWNEKWQGHQTFKVNGDYALTDDGILPYEGNEHLVGTTDEPEEEVKLEKDEYIIASDFIQGLQDACGSVGRFIRIEDKSFVKISYNFSETPYKYAIRFSDFNPNDMEETKKHILCVRNGKVIRYKG